MSSVPMVAARPLLSSSASPKSDEDAVDLVGWRDETFGLGFFPGVIFKMSSIESRTLSRTQERNHYYNILCVLHNMYNDTSFVCEATKFRSYRRAGDLGFSQG